MAELLGFGPSFQQIEKDKKKCTKNWQTPQNINRR
jgi:hypothetical protein